MKKFSTLRPKIEISTRRGATVNVERPKQPSAFSTRLDHLTNSGISYAKIDAVWLKVHSAPLLGTQLFANCKQSIVVHV